MKIEWLDHELNEAKITIGHLWWKRSALVRRLDPHEPQHDACWWVFTYSDFPAKAFSSRLEAKRDRDQAQGHPDLDWHPTRSEARRSRPKLKALP